MARVREPARTGGSTRRSPTNAATRRTATNAPTPRSGSRAATRATARRTPGGDALSALAVQVLRLAGLLIEAGDELARPAGQTSARWRVLAAVEDAPATVATVARALGQARQSVQRIADLLVSERLARFLDDPTDRRAMRLALTPRGRAALRAIQAAQRGWADALGARIGIRALGEASATLERIAAALAAQEQPLRE